MSEITLHMPDNLFNRVANTFGEDALSDFSITAIEELISWLSADQRPTSISELETNRIFLIYNRILKDLLPTAEDIGQSFNLPMGRSRYIVQNLNYRHPEFMKRRRITTIIAALERGEVSDDGLPIAIIPKECEEYLYNISTEMVLAHLMSTTPTRIKLSESIRVELGANDRDPLLQRLRNDLSKLPEQPQGE